MPDPAPPWADHLVQRRGVLRQGPSLRAEATCLDASGEELRLAPIVPVEFSTLKPDRRTTFEVTHSFGITRLSGTLIGLHEALIRRMTHTAVRLVVDSESVAQVNRRAYYRVGVNLKGTVAMLDERAGAEATFDVSHAGVNRATISSQLETLARSSASHRRPCLIRDLSVGGVWLFVGSPPPKAGRVALLDLPVGAVTLHNLPCRIVEGRSEVAPPPFDAQVRAHFVDIPPRYEALLSRYVTEIQLEMLRKGIRV